MRSKSRSKHEDPRRFRWEFDLSVDGAAAAELNKMLDLSRRLYNAILIAKLLAHRRLVRTPEFQRVVAENKAAIEAGGGSTREEVIDASDDEVKKKTNPWAPTFRYYWEAIKGTELDRKDFKDCVYNGPNASFYRSASAFHRNLSAKLADEAAAHFEKSWLRWTTKHLHWFRGRRGMPKFKRYRDYNSLTSRNGQGIQWKSDADGVYRVVVPMPMLERKRQAPLVIPVRLDPKDRSGLQASVLAMLAETPPTGVQILRREIRGKVRWRVQLTVVGVSPKRRDLGAEVVGIDMGVGTIAIFSEGFSGKFRISDAVDGDLYQIGRLQRQISRNMLRDNPDNYHSKGVFKKGRRRWVHSKGTLAKKAKVRDLHREKAEQLKCAHGRLANLAASLGTEVHIEKNGYKQWQRDFGKGVNAYGPATLATKIQDLVKAAGGKWVETPQNASLSSICHGCGRYEPKPLSKRIHNCECGVGPVDRDLYSAFLIAHTNEQGLDADQARETWRRVEGDLKAATSEFREREAERLANREPAAVNRKRRERRQNYYHRVRFLKDQAAGKI